MRKQLQISWIEKLAAVFLTATALVCSSCSPTGGSAFLDSTTLAANNHIMLVRENPPTFGYHRLAALSSRYPDLSVFTGGTGAPDYLAETSKGENRYLILYYLGARKAFACRTGERNTRQVEFSGPYPITDNEFLILSEMGKAPGNQPP